MSKAGNKPTPPPLDDEQANANPSASSDVPFAESGKATAEDAQRAAAEDRRAAARDTHAPTVDATAASAVDTAAGRPPEAVIGDRAPTARAVISESSGQLVARPDPLTPIDEKTVVVVGNWFGQVDGRPAHVKHGTPFDDLPRGVQRAIRATKGQTVGPLPPKASQNPFTP